MKICLEIGTIRKNEKKSEDSNKVRSNSTNCSNRITIKQKMPKNVHHIDLFEIREIKTNAKTNDPEDVMKSFSQMLKQIIETKNSKFLDGDINLIEFILSKYTNMQKEDIKNFESISLKLSYEYGLLNQFGMYLPMLKVLQLNKSIIPSIADIGSSFYNLKELYIVGTGLKDLNGNIRIFNYLRYCLLSKP